ncbi:carboxymuconolactone decarboxylase family protein [Photobacterium makurazakiensis]|uniref:carboxymuconolactone decarboxylase family protein n=1 Tax=Photobacterium makurazakiensis TaxID=2910234 RepID=UPI003D0D46A8
MTRIPYLDQNNGLDDSAAEVFEHINESRGNVIGVFALLLNSPPVAKLTADLGGYLRFDSILNQTVKELVILTTLSENYCQFEWAFHEGFALEAGISPQVVDVIKYRQELSSEPEVSPIETKIISFVRELVNNKRITDSTYQALEQEFSTQELTEITSLTGYYCMVACQLNAFALAAPAGKPHLPEPAVASDAATETK